MSASVDPSVLTTGHGQRAEALRSQFRELLLLACRSGAAPFQQQQLAQLGRRAAAQMEPLDVLLETLGSAADDVAAVLDQTTEDAAQRLQAERRLRRAVFDLTCEVARTSSQSNTALISTLGALDASLAERVEQLDALQEVNSVANSSLHLTDVLTVIAQKVQGVTRSDLCSIYVFDDQRNDLVLGASTGLAPQVIGRARMLLGEGITGWAAQSGQPVAVADAWADPRFKYIPESGEESFRSMLSVPIILFTVRKLVGVLNVQTHQVRDWPAGEIAFMETVAGQIAFAIDNARLYRQTDEELRRKVEQLTTLQRVSALVATNLDVHEVMESIVTYLRELGHADKASIFSYDEQRGEFHIVASRDLSRAYRDRVRVPAGQGVIGEAIRSGEPVQVPDALLDDRIAASPDEIRREGYRSLLVIPLLTKRGPLGAACLYKSEPGHFSGEDIQLLTAFGNEAAIALEKARLYDEVRDGLRTKSTLLAEMHHRVKNNLQTIAALLSMQQRRARGSDERAALGESVARIQSIAAIHDLLSHKDIGIAKVRDIVEQVVSSVTAALSADVRVRYQTMEGGPRIPSKEATVLALVLNELVTNAIQHGFAGRGGGTITVGAEDAGDALVLRVHDDGKGLPAGFSVERDGGLGMQIVRTLVTQDLHGQFALNADGGAVATVRVPIETLLRQGEDC